LPATPPLQGFHVLSLIKSVRLHAGRAQETALGSVLKQQQQDVQELLALLPPQKMPQELLQLRKTLDLDRLVANGGQVQDQAQDFDLPSGQSDLDTGLGSITSHFANLDEKQWLLETAAAAADDVVMQEAAMDRYGLQLLQESLGGSTAGLHEEDQAIRQHVTSSLQLADQDIELQLAAEDSNGKGRDLQIPDEAKGSGSKAYSMSRHGSSQPGLDGQGTQTIQAAVNARSRGRAPPAGLGNRLWRPDAAGSKYQVR
jgi:hypothetical protein